MALSSTSPPSTSSSSSPSFSWAGLRLPVFAPKSVSFASANRTQDNSGKEGTPIENSRFELAVLASKGPVQVPYSKKCTQEESSGWRLDLAAEDIDEKQQKNLSLCGDKKEQESHFKLGNSLRKDCIFAATAHGEEKMVSFRSPGKGKAVEKESYPKVGGKVRKRPAPIVIPRSYQSISYAEEFMDLEEEFQAEGRDFYVASKRGGRKASEDGYGVVTDASGDPKQAFFGVFDGHGGRAAVDYVIEKLGINIITAVGKLEKSDDHVQEAIRAAYLTTDKEFLSQGVGSGVCAATVLLKDGDLHVANVGDCRVVLSRKGVATALTRDHRPDSEDERRRIESSGGYVNYCNGVWRVQGSLAISRAIGDVHLKDWIISKPEIDKFRLTADCEFLIIASDGLWDKVCNQEAVDVVMRHKNSIESCKALVDMSSSRGSKDDITVMVVYLQNFTEAYDQLRVL